MENILEISSEHKFLRREDTSFTIIFLKIYIKTVKDHKEIQHQKYMELTKFIERSTRKIYREQVSLFICYLEQIRRGCVFNHYKFFIL